MHEYCMNRAKIINITLTPRYMSFTKRIPALLRWITAVLLFFLVLMTLYRLLFYWRYNPPGKPISGSAIWMGFRFDLKFCCILAICMLVLCSFPWVNPLKKKWAAAAWNILLPLLFALTLIF